MADTGRVRQCPRKGKKRVLLEDGGATGRRLKKKPGGFYDQTANRRGPRKQKRDEEDEDIENDEDTENSEAFAKMDPLDPDIREVHERGEALQLRSIHLLEAQWGADESWIVVTDEVQAMVQNGDLDIFPGAGDDNTLLDRFGEVQGCEEKSKTLRLKVTQIQTDYAAPIMAEPIPAVEVP